jgi:uncharacterized protein (DUF58 family)
VTSGQGSAPNVRRGLDWGSLAPLRLRARLVAEGVYAGVHRSARRGAGVEFGGYRAYTPGDDLRWLDRRSLLRHDRFLVRQFETETDRALRLVVDATASMGYRGSQAPGAKLAYASLLAAALARIVIGSGDPVGLAFVGNAEAARGVGVSSGREAFERIVASLEACEPGGDAVADPGILDATLEAISRASRRGSVIVVLSDLVDLPEHAAESLSAIASRGRVLVVVQTLDPDEARFPFDGTVRLRALEGEAVVETDAAARDRYLAALERLQSAWERALVARGGRLVRAETNEDPVRVVRRVIEAARGAG